jgi:hypothetical protein
MADSKNSRNSRGWLAFTIYLTLSFLFFGRGLVGHRADRYIGIGPDPGSFIFFLEWWRYAIVHHLNPFLTKAVWAPSGANLALTAIIPFAGIVASPLTGYLGPLQTYNLIMLISPPMAAWAAFRLCRYLSSSTRAAFVGGYIFGFSPYLLGHMLGHPHVLMVFAIPLMLEVILRGANGRLTPWRLVLVLSLLLTVQFTTSLEILATATIFGSIAFAVAWWIAPQWRKRLSDLIFPISCAYLTSAILVSPYLYYFFAFGRDPFPPGMSSFISVRPSGILFPPPTNLLGSSTIKLCGGYNVFEAGSYLALPLLVVALAYFRRHWKQAHARLLLIMMAIIVIASFGPTLSHIGHRTIPMPWAFLFRLPLIDEALPARFMLYAYLVVAIIVGLWLADDTMRTEIRTTAALAIILFSLPNPSAAYWTTDADIPTFFSSDMYKHYLSPGENILILPYGREGNSELWLAYAHAYFRMAGGYVSLAPLPEEYVHYAITDSFYNLALIPHADEALKVFLAQKQVNKVIIADEGTPQWRYVLNQGPTTLERTRLQPDERRAIAAIFDALGEKLIHIGGVSIYNVPLSRLSTYLNRDPKEVERAVAAERLDNLINAANVYFARGLSASQLNPVEAQRIGLLPPLSASGTIYDPAAAGQNGMVLTSLNDKQVLVGVLSSREVVEKLADEYRLSVKNVEVSPPVILTSSVADLEKWSVLMVIDRDQLARVAMVSRTITKSNSPIDARVK